MIVEKTKSEIEKTCKVSDKRSLNLHEIVFLGGNEKLNK